MAQAQILLTGADGFIGKNLVPILREQGYEVWDGYLEVTHPKTLSDFFQTYQPDIVLHLAAISHVPSCERDPKLAFDVNLNGTIHLARALVQYSPATQLIFSSTAQVYRSEGNVGGTGSVFSSTDRIKFESLAEDSLICPQNVYAETKWLAEKALEYYRDQHGLSSIVLRFFNHTHSSQSSQFFLPSVYQQLLQQKNETDPQIVVGNIDLCRDLGSLQDLLRALIQVVKFCETKSQTKDHTFNVCSGSAKNLRILIHSLAERLQVQSQIVVDPERIRPNDPYCIQGDPSRFSNTFGWAPTARSEEELIASFLAAPESIPRGLGRCP